MNNWHRRLITLGLVLILSGFAFGLVFSWAVSHESRLVAYDDYQDVFEEIAKKSKKEQWQPLEAHISAQSIAQRRAADVHGHSINMGIFLILLGLLTPMLGSQLGRVSNRIVLALTVSAVVYPVGLFLQYLRLTVAGEAVSALGAVGVIAALAVLLTRVWAAVDKIGD